MQFLFAFLLLVVVLPTCFTAPGTISFGTTQTEVKENDYEEVKLKIQRSGGSEGTVRFICKILNSTQDDFHSNEDDGEFENGKTSSICVFYVKDDSKAEGNETVVVELSLLPGSNSSLQAPRYSYIKIIANDDAYGVVGFDVPDTVFLNEPRTSSPGSGVKQLSIRRHVGTFGSITVNWDIVSPKANSDITPTSGMLKFLDGEANKSLEFYVRNDIVIEQDEDFTFELTSIIGGARLNSTLSQAVVRILANDIPVRFALSQIAVPENQSEVVVWIYRGLDQNGTRQEASVDHSSSISWYLRSGVAMGNYDFNQTNGTMVFGKGETKKSVTIRVLEDNVPEVLENFTVQLTSLSPDISLAPPSVCTILILPSDDHAGVFKLSGDDVIISEDSGNNYANLTIERAAGKFGRVEVTWRATSSQIGTLSNQVQPTNGSVFFNDGVQYQLVKIFVTQDLEPEEAFSFVVELTGVTRGRLTNDPLGRSQEVKVQDSDDVYGIFEFADDLYQKLTLTSSLRMVDFMVNRHGGSLGKVRVNYEMSYLLPDGIDRTSTINISSSDSVSMVSGQRNVSVGFTISQEGFIRANAVFSILLTNVALIEPAKTLLPPQTPRLGARESLNLTVDPQYADGEIGFEKTSVTVTEPDGVQPKEVKINVLRDGTLYKANLLWSIVDVKASTDVSPIDGSIAFENGVDSVNITIQILPDSIPELDETFTLRLHNVSEVNQRLQQGSSELVLTISRNDNPEGTFQFGNVESIVLQESTGSDSRFSVDVIRLGGDLDERFVNIVTTNGQDDFVPEKEVLKFVKGERKKTETFHVKADDIPEANETFIFRLVSSGPQGKQGRVGNLTAFNVTILANDDANGIIVFLNTSLSIAESKGDNKSVHFFLERQRGLFGDVTIFWNATSNEDSALDISPAFGRVEFAEGERLKALQIFSQSDNVPENDENFTMTLFKVEGGAKIGSPSHVTLTILRNDDAIEFATPTAVRILEGGTAYFTILRKGRHGKPISVNYTTRDGSATSNDGDYEATSQQVSFAIGEVEKRISVSIPDDNKPESDENFTIALTSSTGDTSIYGNTVATVTIAASDDPNGIFHFDGDSELNKTVKEQDAVNFRVVRDRGIFGSVHVLWQVYQIFPNDSRVKLTSGDFKQTSGALVFENGTKTMDLTLEVLSDEQAEYEEQFEVVLVNTTGGRPGPGGEISENFTVAVIRIPTNDHPYGLFAFDPKSLDVSVAEDTRTGFQYEALVNLTVLRKRGRDRNVSVSWCIYSKIGDDNLGDIWDLVFLSEIVGPGVLERPDKKRKNTGSKVLEFTGRNDSYAIVNTKTVSTKEMTISAWIKPKRDVIGTILAKVTTSSIPYKLVIDIKGNVILRLEIRITDPRIMMASADVTKDIFDDSWHNIMVSIDSGNGVQFYCDGDHIGTNSSLTFREILDGPGDWYLGASEPNEHPFQGLLQDVKIFSKALKGSVAKVIAKPVEDLKPINGYLSYPQQVTSHVVSIETVDNTRTEDEKVFSMILTSSSGGADIDDSGSSKARLTVLKSDNANGLFAFSSDQTLSKTVKEAVGNISVLVKRTLASRGQVTVEWEIVGKDGVNATKDFDSAFGRLVFINGEVEKNLTVSVRDDTNPELLEKFTLRLVSAQSNDGKKESAPRSGASIDRSSSECDITIEENDSPYGLLQFSDSPPRNGSIMPLTDVFRLKTRESVGVLKLYVVRAQGVLGAIEFSWRIVAGTAIAGTDYRDDAGDVTLREGETNATIAISLIDNDKPELKKTFRVELYNAKKAQIGRGGVAVVTILPSDDAFGVINFTSSSLVKIVHEGEIVKLELQRTGGTLRPIDVFWEIGKFGDDFLEGTGVVLMDKNQINASLLLTVKKDLLPELSESFLLRLVNVSNGRLASSGIVANVTILANDDPHGVFEFDPVLLSVDEADKNVTLTIARRKGTVGKTRVYYTSVPSSVLVEGLKYGRANETQDYASIKGFVDFQPNQTSGSIVVMIMDDVIPEDNETVVVNLTSVVLISGPIIRPGAVGSPRIGTERLGQVVILRNDNASGIIRLSSSAVTVKEGSVGSFLSVVRSIGTFGEVKVNIKVTPSSAKLNKDYRVNLSTVTIPDGESTAIVPISIINDEDPEFDESFTVRLLSKGPDGTNVLIGSPAQCTVTIEENDYPYGLIGFSDQSMNKIVTEPSSGDQVVTLDVIREYGTRDTARFHWVVTHHGRPATNDVKRTEGEDFIYSGKNKTSFNIVILADNVPEVNEVLLVTLNITQGKTKVNPERAQVNVTIKLNDDAHGVVEFAQDSYTVIEKDQNTVANISIVRKRGTFGDVRVFYSTLQGSSVSSAIPNQDYIPVSNASATIPDGSSVSAVSIVIVGDVTPEFGKSFIVILESVEMINSVGSSKPRIGPLSQANISIEDDDHVYGLFKVFAIDPKDRRNKSRVVVNETDGLAITFVIQRYGGNHNVVTVQLDISKSTASATKDFKGSASTFSFNHGERQKDFLLTIAGDNIPERDEMIIVKLLNPTGGAEVAEGTGNNATVVILANDVVAGKIGFSALSRAVVVNEGQVVELNVIRTAPAAGRVTVEWIIQGDNVTKDFNQTHGYIQFEEGQTMTFMKALVLADNTSEVDEQFQVILRNPVTSDVSWTGAAEIDDRTKTATLTIAANNEPYGVLEFQQSSRRVTVKEDEKVLELSVARLYGNIGTIRLHFTIIKGSIQHLGLDERLATVGEDVAIGNSSISIENGVGIGIIPINIINDGLAELNEYFLVNLTSVELVLPSLSSVNNRTLISPRLGRYLTSEVKIMANDGPYGILVFSPSRVSVFENITVFNLTVLRTQGTHGDIQVHYYIRRLSIQENDFHVYGSLEKGGQNTLSFVKGQRSQNITVFVYDDNNPEGDETFEVWLKTPSGGAQLAGKESVAQVTILVSDGGNGIFKFDAASLQKFVDEAGTTIVGTTKARFTVLRENGTIGVVVIGWSVRNESARMDLKSTNGTVMFKEGETKKSFTIETVVDMTPEMKEKFLVVLSVLSGGGEVMPPSEAWLTVNENDEPYGEFGFAVSSNVLTVEETVGFTELKVIRHKGTYGQVTVNYQTTSKTADGSVGPVMKFGIFQSFNTRNATTWYPFSAYGEQYLLLGASNDSTNGNHGNTPSYTGSSLFRWQGIYTHISEIKTNNAVQWESFSINDQYYIAVANHGMDKNHEVNSTIYKLYQNGTTDFHQHIFTQAASDVKFFKPSGSSSSYLVFSNMKNNAENTVDVFSKVYEWSNGRFIPHGRGLNCRGASGLALFTINGRDMLSISSFYDSVNNNYQSQSIIFEWKNRKFESIQEITTNGATGVEYFKIDGDNFLLFVNSRVSPSLYKWSGTTFLFDQNLPVSNTKTVKEFAMHGEVFFVVTSLYGSSQLLKWNSQKFQFYTNITESGAVDVQPITLQDPVVHNVSLLAVAMAGSSRSSLLQPAMVSPQADYIPRSGQLIFENGDRELSIFVTIFNDSVSEPDESFLVSLSNATGGSIVGPGKDIEVNILSNGNPYGRIGFSKKSVYVIVEERRRDSKVYLEVLREQGKFGEVVVAWNSTGNATGGHGNGDVLPTSGEVVFLEGETRKTINLTIVADDIPEVNEVLFVRLTYLKKDGSDLPTKGASINTAQDMATVLIQSNDEPHGIVGWRRTVVLTQESEAINSTVQLVIERLLGTFGDIEISYRTVEARSNSSFNERPAVPYQDFIPGANRIVMADGVNISTISINVIHDDNAEINEVFFVNITDVRLLYSYSVPSEDSPRISSSSQTAKVIISENDDKRGEFNFNVTHLLDPRTGILRINENIGVLSLQVVRSSGMVGRVGFAYRLVPETRNKNDYFPTKGQIIFLPNVTTHVLDINITDDSEAEVAERFRVEMTQPIGGAKLGNDREVSVEIRASDQPYGVFEFLDPSTLAMKEGDEVLLTVARSQGRFREVHVQWNLSVGAFPDVHPANGTLTFDDNVTSQVIKLKARDDSIPEGAKVYVCHLVSADNGGVIGSEDKVTLRIDVNDDGYGVMAIDPGTSFVFVGEPDLPSYNGDVTVSVVRNVGTYGKVSVDWEIASDDLVAGKTAETFNETGGTLVFGDGVKIRNVTLRVKQDTYPEETGNYTFSLTGTSDTRIDRSAYKATVVVVSSDHPYGILEFVGDVYRNVSEDINQVTLNVVRNKGHVGRLLITINVVENNAIEGRDFQVTPKVLTIEDKQDYGSLNVTILPETVPELSESFTVSLGNIQLITSKPVNYGYKNGLQVDMPPVVGKHDSVVITILKNDDAHGVVEFKESQRVVHEHDKSVVISVIRSGGTFGTIQASYTVINITAQYGKDYLISDGTITLGDGEQIVNLTIPLLDDKLPEDKEVFKLQLTSVNGGARLGERKTVSIVIETSDNPNGLFGFMNQTRLTFNNPNATQLLNLGVSRIGGARSSVKVKIRVFKTFPNNGPITADVSPDTRDLTFAVNQFGPKIFELTILPFIDHREVEEHFVVTITGVSGNASIDSLTSNVTVIILKHGMPNGLFGFESVSTKTVSESKGSPVILTVQRREGREGTVEVKWIVLGSAGAAADFTNNKGTLVFHPGDEQKQISLTIIDDNIPELNEDFTITLLAATGGGDIDLALSKATVTIRANDNPHGAFRLRPNAQRITIEENLSRTLSFTVERIGGKFGEVKVSYSLEYSKETSKGYVTIGNDEVERTPTVVWNDGTFLFPDSHFTVTLTDVSYQGPGVSEIPPTLVSGGSTENIQVPDSAANSIVKFKDGYSTLLVNQDNQVPRILVSRRGFYGNVTVFINNGFPSGKYSRFTKGLVKPSVSQVTFAGNEVEKEFSAKVTPVLVPNGKFVYAIYLSRVSTPSNVNGGSKIDKDGATAVIEAGGVVVVAMASQNIIVKENQPVSITVYRLFSSLGTINVVYSTQSSTATPNKDYIEKLSSQFSMVEGEYRKVINIDIKNDDIPELDESFNVKLTGVTGANARLGDNASSTVTIQDDDSPNGILFFAVPFVSVFENSTTVHVVISRSGGTFGNVGVQVRTVGGGESWNAGDREIENILLRRNKSSIADVVSDYDSLDNQVNFPNEVPAPSHGQNQTVTLTIKNDNTPERDEDIYLYILNPSGGAVLASPSSGKQTWTVVRIKGNDLMNGKIGFKTTSLTMNEDKDLNGEVTVERAPSLGTAKIKWEAFDSGDNLEQSTGTIVFHPNEASTKLLVQLKNDNKPELKMNFTLKLVSLVETPEATIDVAKSVVSVTILDSDDPRGLIAFDQDSRNVAVDSLSEKIELNVVREQGLHGKVTVSYRTTMLPEPYKDGGLEISRAIEDKDYIITQGTLEFEKTSIEGRIVIELKRGSDTSSSSYPKAFSVTLYNITGGARLDDQYSTTTVIINNEQSTAQFLKLRSESLKTPLSNSKMTSVLQSLLNNIKQPSLPDIEISIVTNIMNNILDYIARRPEEKQRQLTKTLSESFIDIFNFLLNPEREDFRGKTQFSEPFVKYAFSLVNGRPCPDTSIIRQSRTFATVEGRRRLQNDVNGLILASSSAKNSFTYPSNIYPSTNQTSLKCEDIHFIEYHTSHWFNKDNKKDILNDRVLSTSLKNTSEINLNKVSSVYRIYAGERRVTPKGAECLKWSYDKGSWDNTICSVKKESDDFVECECRHFSNFAIRAQSDDRVGYQFYFYIAAFICMISFFLVIFSHHVCSIENTFSSKLLMHMFFAGFALHLLVIVAAYVTPDLTDKPTQCATLGILIHYFLLAHFCWIFVQCCNLWRILVLNDEQTDRKFILFFMIGWGIPLVFVALYIIITHALYGWDVTDMYADVHDNGDMCFIKNIYGALTSVLAPVLLFLLGVCVVASQAYQVTLQWKLYDDIFRGHHNIKEVVHLWVVFIGITLTWLFGGLHLAYGKLWLAILFSIFELLTGLYVFMVYFVLRNQCRGKYRNEAHLPNASLPSMFNGSPTDYYAERPVMYDAQSVQSSPKSDLHLSPPDGNEWDEFEYDGTTPKGSRRGMNDSAFAQINPLYEDYHGKKLTEMNDENMDDDEELSQDFNHLIYALKTGETREDFAKEEPVELKVPESIRTDKLELRRVNIADTHV